MYIFEACRPWPRQGREFAVLRTDFHFQSSSRCLHSTVINWPCCFRVHLKVSADQLLVGVFIVAHVWSELRGMAVFLPGSL